MTSRRLRTAASALLAWIFLVAGAARAAAAREEPARETAPVQDPSPSGLASPRDAMREFLPVFGWLETKTDDGLSRAAAVFDLSGEPPARRRARGRESAERLAHVLDRVARLDLEAFPDAAEIGARSSWVFEASPPGHPEVLVRIGFARTEAGWLIDQGTVERLYELWTAVRDLPPVGNVSAGVRSPAQLLRERVRPELKGGGFLMEPYQWIGLAVLLALAFLVERFLRLFLAPLVRRLSRTDGLVLDPELLARFARPIGWLIQARVFLSGLPVLDVEPKVERVLDLAARTLFAFAAVWAIYRLVDVVSWKLEQRAARTASTFDDMLVPLARRTLKTVVLVVGVVYLASWISGDVWHVLAGLSIGSLAVGFAAKESIENLFGTFTVLLDTPFKLGDAIAFDGMEGVVEQVGFRATRLRTPEDSVITVPNSKFISSAVNNLGARRSKRVRALLSLRSDTPPEKVEAFCEGVRELIRSHPRTRKDFYLAWLNEFGASSLDVQVVFLLDAPDPATESREKHRLYVDVLRLARRLDVDFAFPTRALVQVRPEDLEHPDTPPDAAAAIARGRESARGVASESLARFGGRPPPPVRFDLADPDAASPLAPP